ncbi:hypothetical protein cyc_00096 [Cyclospora cayetanensis]|uniref:Uncharacterized protein n=1 Tax=Cyclospora cayetanensis TaxID=88456 RepID=A0A1D3D8L0_9EIME|nr:hypothetical protein cyc_00096 [Cyclospora cayetanensis]
MSVEVSALSLFGEAEKCLIALKSVQGDGGVGCVEGTTSCCQCCGRQRAVEEGKKKTKEEGEEGSGEESVIKATLEDPFAAFRTNASANQGERNVAWPSALPERVKFRFEMLPPALPTHCTQSREGVDRVVSPVCTSHDPTEDCNERS